MKDKSTILQCRQPERFYLNSYLNASNTSLPDSLFVFGPINSGKTSLVREVLQSQGYAYAVTSAFKGSMSPRLIFEDVLSQLTSETRDQRPDFSSPFPECDSFSDFVGTLTKVFENSKTVPKIVIALTNAEKLRDIDGHILPSFLRLREFCAGAVDVCVVLVSRVPWNKFQHPSLASVPSPIPVVFRPYAKDELSQIVAAKLLSDSRENTQLEKKYDLEFYKTFSDLVVSIFSVGSRSVPFFTWIAESLVGKYREPVERGTTEKENARALYRQIEPEIKAMRTQAFIREVDPNSAAQNSGNNSQNLRLHVELPYHSKYLLIASYLASYNPAGSDKRFFVKASTGAKKRLPTTSRSREKLPSQLTGPKAFPLDRMMAIFHAIVDENVTPSALISNQIASLVTLQFLTSVGSEDTLDAPKYKCNIGLDFVGQISKQVEFEIYKFLYDFAVQT